MTEGERGKDQETLRRREGRMSAWENENQMGKTRPGIFGIGEKS